MKNITLILSNYLLQRVENKLKKMPPQEVIDDEWKLNNFSAKDMILSIMDIEPIIERSAGNDTKIYLENEYRKWRSKK